MCSYCGCESIAVVGRFMREHVDIINASGDLRRAVDNADREAVEEAAQVLAGLLNPHTNAEEVGLFAVMREQEEFTEHIDSLCAEHDALDDQLARVRAGEYQLLGDFIHALRVHIDREDNGLFPASAIALDGPDWERVDDQTPGPASGSAPDHAHGDDHAPGDDHAHPHPHDDHAHPHPPLTAGEHPS